MDFLDAGGSVYLEGNDFGYFHANDPIYDYFGCIWAGDGDLYNVDHLYGQPGTMLEDLHLRYPIGEEVDEWTDEIESAGGTILLRCQDNHGRAISWDGPSHNYRTIHSTFVFGAMIDQEPPHTKEEVMDAYMEFLYPEIVVPPHHKELLYR